MPKKILIVTEFFYPEEFKINDIALSWKDKGYDVDVLTLNPTYPLGKVFPGYKNSFFSKFAYKGVKIYRIRAVTGYRDSLAKKILRYINFMILGAFVAILIGRRYDYVFGFNVGALTSMFPAVIVRKLYNKPLMFWVQDLWPDSVYAYGFRQTKLVKASLNIFVRFVYNSATAMAISGVGFESKLRCYVNNDIKFNYLPNWADDLNIDLDTVSLSQDSLIHFTFAGNIGKVQNLENIIKAFLLLPSNYQKRAQLNIIGDGSNLNNLKAFVENNLYVVFHGKKDREKMSQYYKASDFLIISLVDEPVFSVTVPAKMQTYIAAKKPILAIINGDTAKIVKENNLGLCANPSDIKSIIDLFKCCIDMNAIDRKKFTKESERLLGSVFNKNKIINKLTKILINE